MLVLTRRKLEAIVIDHKISVTLRQFKNRGGVVLNISHQDIEGILITTMNLQEEFLIGDNISIIVLGVKGNQVRFGVNAPKNISIHRAEIEERISIEGSTRITCEIPLLGAAS